MEESSIVLIMAFTFLIMLGFGIWGTVFGLRLLFQKGFVEKKYGTLNEQKERPWFGKKDSYNYNKYTRGIEALATGLVLLAGCIWILVYKYFL